MYLGELARRVIVDLAEPADFKSVIQPRLAKVLGKPWCFDTEMMGAFEASLYSCNFDCVQTLFLERYQVDISVTDAVIIGEISKAISTRAARLVACEIIGIKNHRSFDKFSVGIDGSMFESYPQFGDRIYETLALFDITSVKLGLAKDGSGIGAALAAALVLK